MSQVFSRSDQLREKVFEIKLQMNEWKVLFAVDGKKDAGEIASFLELDPSIVESTLTKFSKMNLLVGNGGFAAPASEDVMTEEAPAEIDMEEVDTLLDESEDDLEAMLDEVIEEESSEAMGFADDTVEETEDLFADLEDITGEEAAPPSTEETGQPAEAEYEAPGAPEEETSLTDETDDSEEDFLSSEEDSLDFDSLLAETEEALDDAPQAKSDFDEIDETVEADEDEDSDDSFDSMIGDLLDDKDLDDAETALGGGKEDLETLETEDEFDLSSIFDEDLIDTEDIADEADTEELPETDIITPAAPAPVTGDAAPVILVVDDSVVIRKMVEIALENENYQIISVASGKEALNYLDENNPDLIILDIMLSDINGLDVLKAVKASKNIPVVMLSAKDTPRETTRARQLGADDFIPKPFKDEELVGKIKELIRK